MNSKYDDDDDDMMMNLNYVVLHADEVKSYTVDEKMKKAKKLHRQFAHSSVEKLLTLIWRSKFKDKELEKCVEEVTGDCSFCRKYKKAPSRPIVEFNDLISMDLKDYIHNEIWILHLIDAATRYSAACLIYSKKKDVVVSKIFQIWISYFGAPKKMQSDNGGEFNEENDVYEIVPDEGQSTISTKWIISEKVRGEVITKARLVACGFEEQTELRADSPTCTKQSFRMTLISAATKKWKVHSIDITAPILQGYEIDHDVYLKPPPDIAEPGFIWKLKRCIYGFNDAPRAWYQRVSNELIDVGGKQSTFDPALFL